MIELDEKWKGKIVKIMFEGDPELVRELTEYAEDETTKKLMEIAANVDGEPVYMVAFAHGDISILND